MDALAGMLLYSAGVMRPAAQENFKANTAIPDLEAQWPPEDSAAVAEVVDRAKAIAGKDPLYRMERFVQRHVAEEMMARNVVMAEERRTIMSAWRLCPAKAPAERWSSILPRLSPTITRMSSITCSARRPRLRPRRQGRRHRHGVQIWWFRCGAGALRYWRP